MKKVIWSIIIVGTLAWAVLSLGDVLFGIQVKVDSQNMTVYPTIINIFGKSVELWRFDVVKYLQGVEKAIVQPFVDYGKLNNPLNFSFFNNNYGTDAIAFIKYLTNTTVNMIITVINVLLWLINLLLMILKTFLFTVRLLMVLMGINYESSAMDFINWMINWQIPFIPTQNLF